MAAPGACGRRTRRVPPRCADCGASAATHTDPPATTIAEGRLAVLSRFGLRGPSGSTRATVPSSPPAPPTAPSPPAPPPAPPSPPPPRRGILADPAPPRLGIGGGVDPRERPIVAIDDPHRAL